MQDQIIKKIIRIFIAILITILIATIIALLILKYNVEGEDNVPFELSKIMVISTGEGKDIQEEQSENKWNLEILQNNDIYLEISKNKNYEEIEKSIVTTYRKKIWTKFVKGVKEFEMIADGDKIAVCISGGKDSMLLAKCMQEIKRHGKVHFDLKFICMNPGYQKQHLQKIKENAELLHLPLQIFDVPIFESIEEEKNPCYVCARKRRGTLYHKAQDLGCNKIALGHHFDDVIETIMLNMLYAGQYGSMLPKLKSDHYEEMTLIRPLYLVREKDIKKWVVYNELEFIDCACKITKKKIDSKRREMKELIEKLKETYEDVDKNIFASSRNVNLNTILEYYDGEERINFLDRF